MTEKFLHETVLEEFGRRTLRETEIPTYITDNLNPAFPLRPYQEEAFVRFILCFENDFEDKEKPLHLLFNMATGSGKTLIMAGLILYLLFCSRHKRQSRNQKKTRKTFTN